jgi:hypothetical protein
LPAPLLDVAAATKATAASPARSFSIRPTAVKLAVGFFFRYDLTG